MIKTILILIVYAISSSLGLAIIKMSMNKSEMVSMYYPYFLITEWRFWIGAFLYGTGFIVWLILLKLNDLSSIFPSAAGSIVISTALLGHFYLGESITIKVFLGISLIIFGVYLVTSK